MSRIQTTPDPWQISAEIEVTIPFHDVDMMAVAWHGHYFRYIELARCALLDLIDYNYPQMEASGYLWPIIDTRMKYLAPLRFGQRVRVRATLTEQVAAACLLAAVQGVELRLVRPTPFTRPLGTALAAMVAQVRAEFAPLLEDRALEQELRALIARIRQRHYPLYGPNRN